ncbi:hypothetical protein [Anaeromyxobacter diazotrophicus]|uniref:Uncharacterized protein n=1 Tax=Anaeromyxobacter diazotrophicus TaxID=2590199 RepID=A0A7I9VMA7_9BACT|nr:hypothetical protein [Anaeromyxobacter diazotrophicus]GEJ57532.1 hypothetical protein AMYX_22730 [Anaeromyxobacter diazotrophicus]
MFPVRAHALSTERRDGVWPRVYRPSRGHRLLLGGLGALMLGAGVVCVGVALARGADDAVVMSAVAAGFALLGGFLVAAVRAERVVLFEDAIEFVELGRGRRRLRRDDIAGLRTVALQYGQQQLVFERRGAARKPVKVGFICERDEVLDAWLAALPDLDLADRLRAEAELLGAPALGRTEEERAGSLARARTIARAVTGLAIGAAAWGWLRPRPYPLAIAVLAAIPPVAVALLVAGRGRYSAEGRRNDVRPGLALPLILPGAVLALRALLDFHVLDHRPLLVWAGCATLLMAALVLVGEPSLRRRWPAALLLALLVGAHPWGALAEANVLLDGGEAQRFEATVVDKHVVSGKHTSYDLRLTPWGPVREEDTVEVDRALYEGTEVGDEVCVALKPGALGVRWFVVARCR